MENNNMGVREQQHVCLWELVTSPDRKEKKKKSKTKLLSLFTADHVTVWQTNVLHVLVFINQHHRSRDDYHLYEKHIPTAVLLTCILNNLNLKSVLKSLEI